MKTITLTEWKPYHPKSDEWNILGTLVDRNILKLTYKDGKPAVVSERLVGYATIDDVRIEISPHLADAEIINMLSYAMYVPHKWIEHSYGETSAVYAIPDLFAYILYTVVKEIIRKGIQMKYRKKREVASTLSGRPLMRHIARYVPFKGEIPVEVWYRYSDTILNRLMLATAMYIYRHAQSTHAREKMAEIAQLLLSLGIKEEKLTPSLLKDAVLLLNRAILHYKPALDIATVLLSGMTYSKTNEVKFSGFFVDMAYVFELATLRYLSENYEKVDYQKHVSGVITGYKETDIIPDFVIRDGEKIIIADAKYRDIGKMGAEVIYQINMYTLAMAASEAYVYYPGEKTYTTYINLYNKRVLMKWIGLKFS